MSDHNYTVAALNLEHIGACPQSVLDALVNSINAVFNLGRYPNQVDNPLGSIFIRQQTTIAAFGREVYVRDMEIGKLNSEIDRLKTVLAAQGPRVEPAMNGHSAIS